MVRLATYTVITPNKFDLDNIVLTSKKFDFTLEPDADIGLRTVLFYNLFFLEDANALSFEVRINGKVQQRLTWSGSHFCSIHALVAWLLLKRKGIKNSIEFRIKGGTGHLEIDNVVLFYQKNVSQL